jgi:hypothetical protein
VTESDFGTFERAFGRVSGAFRLRFKANEAEDLTRTYFRILEAHPLPLVLLAVKHLLSVSRKFPLAADWVAAVQALETGHQPADVRQMTTDELDEHEAAERARWEGAPCSCVACVRANVGQSPPRFVPTHATADTYERAYNPQRHQVQIVGHWVHGAELAAWYRARAACYASAPTRYRRALSLVGAGRDPGMEG